MRPGREIDARIAQEVFGYEVWAKNKVLHERTEQGERPLKFYTRDPEWAWQVAEKMRISLIPVEGSQWFAFANSKEGWESPQAFLKYLEDGDFSDCGASVGPNAAAAICEAALKVIDKRKLHLVRSEEASSEPLADSETTATPDLH